MSNFVETGLSHSDGDPALQGSFWFNFGPQFRMGVWGSNVSYDGSDAHFLLRLNADLKVNFTADNLMIIRYSENQHFKKESRDGNILGLEFNFFGYGIHYERHSNFFGTETHAMGYAFSKTWPVFQTWKWQNKLGYMMLDGNDLSNYFYYETLVGTRGGSVDYWIGGSYNSSSSQFGDAGKPALILKATVGF